MLAANPFLMTKTCSRTEELAELWDLIPKEVEGYAMTLKSLTWYADKEHDLPLGDVLEARFFWQGGEVSWQAQQQFTGEEHQRLYQVVLVYDKPVSGYQQHPQSKSVQKDVELFLYPGLIDKQAEGIDEKDLPRVKARCWTDGEDQALYWQWIELLRSKERQP